jgi:hypothetical protein
MQQMEAMADSRQTADALIKAAEEEHTKFAKELAAVRCPLAIPIGFS